MGKVLYLYYIVKSKSKVNIMKKLYFEIKSHLDMLKRIETQNYKVNEVVCREGAKTKMIYIVKNGVFSISRMENESCFCDVCNFYQRVDGYC